MYFSWNQLTLSDFSEENIADHYHNGYVFTRVGKGSMDQTRSLRVDLSQFELSSENRRIIKKTDGLELSVHPLPFADYHWSIGKMGKDFYETKFGDGTFSANKIKELLSDENKSNFNQLFVFIFNGETIGYCIAYISKDIMHYCYPFYDLEKAPKDMGMGMMLRAILYAQEQGEKYIYLGSAQRPGDTYKLQFRGVEWFDGDNWQTNGDDLKNILANI